MAHVGRQLHRCAHLVADEMDDIEELRQPDEVAVVTIVAGSPTALAAAWPTIEATVRAKVAAERDARKAAGSARCQC